MKDNTLLDIAKHHIDLVELILKYRNDDELSLNQAGYHLQQATELGIKYELEKNGVEYLKVHNLRSLLNQAKSQDVSLLVPKFINDNKDMLSYWEANTRYITDFALEYDEVNNALKYIKEYIDNIDYNYSNN